MFYLYNVLLSSPAGSFVCWYSLPVRAYLLKTNTTQVYAPYRASQETKLWTKRFNSDCRQRCILVLNEIFKTDCVHFYLEVIRWFFVSRHHQPISMSHFDAAFIGSIRNKSHRLSNKNTFKSRNRTFVSAWQFSVLFFTAALMHFYDSGLVVIVVCHCARDTKDMYETNLMSVHNDTHL